MPLNIVFILLFLALIFYKKKPSFSFKCLTAGTLILFVSSMSPFSDLIMAPIENNYPVFNQPNKSINYIVILGCGHTTDNNLPEISQLKTCSLQRLAEAFRIYRLHPEATLITSGHAYTDIMSNAEKVKLAAISFGIPINKIIVENYPKDTEEEAQLIAPRVKGTNFALVTNANHMPRSMKYFQEQGVEPIAAPTGYWVKDKNGDKYWAYYLPNVKALEQTTTAWYETLGLVVQWLKNILN